MHIKGTTSMNPDSYIFSYVEKHKNHSLEMSSLVCVCVRERERQWFRAETASNLLPVPLPDHCLPVLGIWGWEKSLLLSLPL